MFPLTELKSFKSYNFFMAEDYELCTYEKHHKHKLILFLTSMRKYASELKNNDFNLKYFQLTKKNMNLSYEDKISKIFKDKKIQMRFSGDASIHNGNSYCKKKGDNMSKQSKECYYQNINPGDTIDSPDEVKSEIKEGISRSFSIIDINIIKIDWLHLSSLGHTRAKFTKENNFQGEWIAP